MFSGGKNQYQNLAIWLEREHPELYSLIRTLCLTGAFSTMKYQSTFLLPSKKLVDHLKKLSEDDNEKEAIDGMRALLLKGHIEPYQFKKGAMIGTMHYGKQVLEDPEAVGKLLTPSDKKIVSARGNVVSIVYKYSGDTPPKTVEGDATPSVPVAKGGAAVPNEGYEIVNKMTKSLVVKGDARATVQNFFKAVTAALMHLKKHDEQRFNKAKFFLAASPIVSWFLLTMQGCKHALIRPDEVEHLDLTHITKFDIIQNAETAGNYTFNKELMRELSQERQNVIANGDKITIPKKILDIYKRLLPKYIASGAATDMSVELKLRMDELRFLYDNAIEQFEDIEDAIDDLSLIENYSNPTKRIVCADSEMFKSMVSPTEAFTCVPDAFIRSAYMMYMPLTHKVERQLTELLKTRNGGAINGGNPATINTVAFHGGAAREAMADMSKDHLDAFVDSLDEEDRERLLALLKKE